MTIYEQSLKLLNQRQKQLDPDNYNIVFMGDSWVGDKSYTSNEIFRSAMEGAKVYNPLLILHGGDLVFNGEKEFLKFFIDPKNNFVPDLPLFVIAGNHDMDRRVTGNAAVANFKALIGPLHYTLNIPDYRFTLIVLDSLYHYKYSNYGLTDTELKYLRDNLQHSYQNTFVAMHAPPATDTWVPGPGDDTYFTIDSEAFFNEVEGDATAVLVSHIHKFDTTEYKNTKLYLSGGGGATLYKNAIFHILVITIKKNNGKNELSFKVIPIGRG